LNVGTAGSIQDLNLGIELDNSLYTDGNLYWKDLDISLNHNSTTVKVQEPLGGAFGAFNVAFDDEATNSLPSSGPRDAIGTFLPLQNLSAFDGQELSGTWTLSFVDPGNAGEGDDLVAWSLSGNAASSSVPESSPSLGLLLMGGLFSSTHFFCKYKTKKIIGQN
jgi:hypothetical protein